MSTVAATIRCNGATILIDETWLRPSGEWGSEQCEGCGRDIAETGDVVDPPLRYGSHVRCRQCGATYPIRIEEDR